MNIDVLIVLTVSAVLGSGLMAGIFFTFSVFAMRALGRLPTDQGVRAMQSINIVILNPLFFLVFFGTAAVSVVLVAVPLFGWNTSHPFLLVLGGLTYLIGGLLITMICNVPLNNELENVPADSQEAADLWPSYLSRWTAWNHVRTVASLAATLLFMLALR